MSPMKQIHHERALVLCGLLHGRIDEQTTTRMVWDGYTVRQNTRVEMDLIRFPISNEQYATNRKNSG